MTLASAQLGLVERILTPREFRLPRIWSNRELRRLAPLFGGEVINVSAWRDSDKEGGYYRDYFSGASRYYLSNYGGVSGESDNTDFQLDLEAELPRELHARFDAVFNHTTLEHVFDVFTAVRNLCVMSRDVVIVVVPFLQRVHTEASFSDYWRFTHHALHRLFQRNGLDVVYLSSTNVPAASVYHVCVATRHPEKWKPRLAGFAPTINEGNDIVSPGSLSGVAQAVVKRLKSLRSARSAH